MEISTTTVNSVLVQIGNALEAAKQGGINAGHYFDDEGLVCNCDTMVRTVNLESQSVINDLNALLRDIYAITPSSVAMQSINSVSHQTNHLAAFVTPAKAAPYGE